MRLAKTRSQAADLVKTGKIRVNDEVIKASREIKPGDQIQIKRNTALFVYEVLQVLDKRVGARLVVDYLRDLTSEDELEKYQLYLLAQKEYRQSGFGKPTKKQRRDLGRFKGE